MSEARPPAPSQGRLPPDCKLKVTALFRQGQEGQQPTRRDHFVFVIGYFGYCLELYLTFHGAMDPAAVLSNTKDAATNINGITGRSHRLGC